MKLSLSLNPYPPLINQTTTIAMPDTIEFIGYAASFFVLVSFLMKNMTYLRTVNLIGCGFFIWYGIVLQSWPIVITNAAIVLVNSFYLLKPKK